MYLAEKSGQFLSTDPRVRFETLQWLFFQVGGIGPMFGQFGHFFKHAKDKCDHPYPVKRYTDETRRLFGVLEARLTISKFLAGGEYSIADMATVTWVKAVSGFDGANEALGLSHFPRVRAWSEGILSRPLTQKGLTVCSV
jgi:GST-like protein